MASRIDDYALIGNMHTAALVARDGSIDWLCLPRFDGPACFAALLGTRDHGRWTIHPANGTASTVRRYRPDTLILETEFSTPEGAVRVIDCMPMWDSRIDVVRVVEGLRGSVPMRMELVIRFGYGAVVPWVRRIDDALLATGGPDTLELRTPVEHRGEGFRTVAEFTVHPGQRIPFVLTHSASHAPRPVPIDAEGAIAATESAWRRWCGRCSYHGAWGEAVRSSLVVLKALTHAPTGGIIAAPTTSLPEQPGGVRNWDYRYCWVRDATFTLYALLLAGYRDEADAWRDWLLRAAAGRPQDLQVLYGAAGERQLTEFTIPWLPGYEGSSPVRIGNAAAGQFQLDVYGEVIDALCLARSAGLRPIGDAWRFQCALADFLESHWTDADRGIWEMRGEAQPFTHSKVMAWVGLDRMVKTAQRHGLDAPIARWAQTRERIHASVCRDGFDARRGTFVQRFGADELDASLLLLPIVGFLPFDDPRVRGTIAAIERELVVDGFVVRYSTHAGVDGLPPGEGVFLPCSLWLADALVMCGRRDDAVGIFERVLATRNDVGLLAEEYDPRARRQLGNFPQALTHVALINTARNLSQPGGPSAHRSRGMSDPPEVPSQPPPQTQPVGTDPKAANHAVSRS